MHEHLRASSGLSFDFDGASFVSDDAINRGQAQSVSLSGLLGGKERLEQPGMGFGVHPTTVVADGEQDPGIARLLGLAAA